MSGYDFLKHPWHHAQAVDRTEVSDLQRRDKYLWLHSDLVTVTNSRRATTSSIQQQTLSVKHAVNCHKHWNIGYRLARLLIDKDSQSSAQLIRYWTSGQPIRCR